MQKTFHFLDGGRDYCTLFVFAKINNFSTTSPSRRYYCSICKVASSAKNKHLSYAKDFNRYANTEKLSNFHIIQFLTLNY